MKTNFPKAAQAAAERARSHALITALRSPEKDSRPPYPQPERDSAFQRLLARLGATL